MLLTAELLLHYQRCHRRAFLDVCGDRTQKDPYSDFQIKLQQERLAHQQFILEEQIRQGAPVPHQPEYPRRNWQAGAEATIALMQQGVERIYGGVLLATGEVREDEEKFKFSFNASPQRDRIHDDSQPSLETVTLISCPDLLVRQPGKSFFGDWVYIPIDIHLGKRPKQEYQIMAAYHAQLLALVQGGWGEEAWLILRGKGEYEVDLWRSLPLMQTTLEGCIQTLRQERSPDVFISRQQCSLCPWLTSCYAIAKSQQHLSLLPGVTPIRYEYLQKQGLTTLESLAHTNPTDLEPAINSDIAENMVRQAQSVLYNQAIATSNECFIPTAPVELYFDIEAEPELNLDYLLGVLVVDREAKTEKFYPLLAEDPNDEELIWQQFLALVERYPKAPIFHFSPYEADTVKRLAKRYCTPVQQISVLLSRFVDLHLYLTDAVTLPLEGYSLKAIANWIGFHWRDPQANGSQAICWYDEWLETRDRALLDIIVRYNEDDCHATRHVKDWLIEFLQNGESSPSIGDKLFQPSLLVI